jgi:biotin transporter BioY
MGVVLTLLAVFNADAATIYARQSGLGSTGIIALMVVVSAAIIGWFIRQRRQGNDNENIFVAYLAPVLTIVSLGVILAFAILRFDLVVGGAPGELTWLVLLHVVALAAGVTAALFLRRTRPRYYERLGRAQLVVTDPGMNTIRD